LETQIEAYCLDELLRTDDTHNKSVALALLLRADNMHFWDDRGLRAGLRNGGNFFAEWGSVVRAFVSKVLPEPPVDRLAEFEKALTGGVALTPQKISPVPTIFPVKRIPRPNPPSSAYVADSLHSSDKPPVVLSEDEIGIITGAKAIIEQYNECRKKRRKIADCISQIPLGDPDKSVSLAVVMLTLHSSSHNDARMVGFIRNPETASWDIGVLQILANIEGINRESVKEALKRVLSSH